MEALDTTACFMVDDEDDLLNFSLDEQDDDDDKTAIIKAPFSSLESSNPLSQDPNDHSCLFPDFVEEELEWLSNKDAFPAVETCLDILSGDHSGIALNHLSPVSVLENSSSSSNSNGSTIMSCCGSLQVPVNYPVGARSKRRRRRRRDGLVQQSWWWNQVNIKNNKQESPKLPPPPPSSRTIGRRCQHCQADKTPQWRAGPMGPKTLCNACGVRYKSGRLVPEYRPASSPTFSSSVHSNSHRKIVEMRKQKQEGMGGMMVVNEACGGGGGYRVG